MDTEQAMLKVRELDLDTLASELCRARMHKEQKAIREMAIDVCYDRAYCRGLGIDYSRINDVDFAKAMVFALYKTN